MQHTDRWEHIAIHGEPIIILKEKQIMNRNDKKRSFRIAGMALLFAGVVMFAGCGGGGGGGAAPVPPLKSGDVVWTHTVNPSAAYDDEVYGVAVDSTALYAVGFDSSTLLFDDQWRIEKRDLSDGALLTTFASPTGVIVSNPSATTINSFDDANAIAIDSTYMYVVGYDAIPDIATGVSSLTDDEWRIEKRRKDTGALDSGFGIAGSVVSNATPSDLDEANAIAIDSTYMYVIGFDTTPTPDKEWRIEKRLLSTGATVTAFGLDGVVQSDPSAVDDVAKAIALDDTNTYMYVGGYETGVSGYWGWRLEKRLLSTGATVTAFGVNGVVSVPSITGNAIISAIAVDALSLYVVGHVVPNSGNTVWQIEKRNISDGSLDATFNAAGVTPGVVVSDPNPAGLDAPKALAIDANYLYVAGFDTATPGGKREWRVEKRNISDGALVSSFAVNGVYQSHPSAAQVQDDDIWAIAIDAGYLYIAGYDTTLGSRQWRIQKIVK